MPYFLLCTTGPLLQAWFAREKPGSVPTVHFGSMLGLLSYPLLFEPSLDLPSMSWLWSSAYAMFCSLAAILAWRGARHAGGFFRRATLQSRFASLWYHGAHPESGPQMRRIDLETESAVRRFLDLIDDQYHPAGAIIFGSRARGTHRADSDADVAVILQGPPGKFITTKLDMSDSAYDVLLETGIRIQPLPIWESEWEHPEAYSNPQLLRNIEREGIRLRAGRGNLGCRASRSVCSGYAGQLPA